jgi:hypothetical protein
MTTSTETKKSSPKKNTRPTRKPKAKSNVTRPMVPGEKHPPDRGLMAVPGKEDASRAAVGAIRKALQVLVAPDQVAELRILPDRQAGPPRANLPVRSGFFDADHLAEMAEQAERWSVHYPHYQGVYFTLNPLKPELLDRRRYAVDAGEKGTLAGNEDVVRRRWLLVDVDPERPTDTSATDAEKAEARKVIEAVRAHLRESGWPEPILSDSGNGYHLLYRIDLPADDGDLVKRVLAALARRFDNGTARVDTAVFNPARICKLPGTWARKGTIPPSGLTASRGCWRCRPTSSRFRSSFSGNWLPRSSRRVSPGRRLCQQTPTR